MTNLRHYLYINEDLINECCEQYGVGYEEKLDKSKSFSLSIRGPAVEIKNNASKKERSIYGKIVSLETSLQQEGVLLNERPQEMQETRGTELRGNDKKFVVENVTATRIIIPKSIRQDIEILEEMAVCISEPDENLYVEQPWAWRGTFLYLVQSHWSKSEFRTVWSGCSALQAIVNNATGKPLFSGNREETYGRWNPAHPIQKLKGLGGYVSEEKRVRVLYRMHYMTDEQCYVVNGKERRVNDLLAYPLYIAE